MRPLLMTAACFLLVTALAIAPAPTRAAAGTITVTIESGTPVDIPINPPLQVGDRVDIQATLTTTDPNENGEGEPLIIQSSGGFSATIPEYEQTRAFTFTATVPGETVSAFIQGFDGDESGSVTLNVNPVTRPQFTPAQKAALARASSQLNTQAAAETVIGVLCLGAPDPAISKICAIAAGLLAGSTWLLSGLLNQLALDPPDPNFTKIAKPNPPKFKPVQPGAGITAAEASTMNALLTNHAQAIGLSQALDTTLNRASGAAVAGNKFWEKRQLDAAATYKGQLQAILAKETSALTAAQSAIEGTGSQSTRRAAGFVSQTATADDVLQFERSVAGEGGLPQVLVDGLREFGADDATIDHVRRLIIVQDVNAVAGSFPAKLTDPPVIDSIQQLAAQLPMLAQDVTSQVRVTQVGKPFIVDARNATIGVRFAIRNISGQSIQGPVSLVVDGISANVRLVNANGTTAATTPAGSPFVNVNVGPDNALTPGETATVVLAYKILGPGPVTSPLRVLAGPGGR
jgi:hypothetical protein